MPLYAYECEKCAKQREVLQRYDDPAPDCDKCDQAMKRKISAGNFHLRGNGWAKDRYGLKPIG